MYVKQISVFLENASGALAKPARLLADEGIDLIAISIADTEHYGILRLIASDTERGLEILKNKGYTVKITEVLAACVPDAPGGLACVLELLAGENISVEYLYSFVRTENDGALIIFHLSDNARGAEILIQHGVRLLSQEQIKEL